MTQKERCINFCKEQLENLQLSNIFSLSEFNSYYTKHNCYTGNAYIVGLHIADYIIFQQHSKIQPQTQTN